MPPNLTSLVEKIRAQASRDRNFTATLRQAVDANALAPPPAPPPPRLVPLLRIAYLETDPLGPLAAAIELLPLLGCVAMVAWLAARRELRTAWGLCGLALSTALSLHLPPADALSPSAHVQAVAFLVAWSFLASWRRLSRAWRFAGCCTSAALVAAVASARVHLGDDTLPQVSAGALLGSGIAGMWLAAFVTCGRAALLSLLESRLGRSLLLRDSSHIPDLLAAEHEWLRSMRQAKAS
jgi:hypothetical protein